MKIMKFFVLFLWVVLCGMGLSSCEKHTGGSGDTSGQLIGTWTEWDEDEIDCMAFIDGKTGARWSEKGGVIVDPKDYFTYVRKENMLTLKEGFDVDVYTIEELTASSLRLRDEGSIEVYTRR